MYFFEIFFMETMNNRKVGITMVDLKVWLGYDHVFIVNHVNTWGGLAFFLENSV